jgi:glycosyltransferase involved in cell wall biosynthesis
LIGAASPNQAAYYKECKRIAAPNIKFLGHLPQQELIPYYQQAKVHVLPSWFETTGLSSLEAAAMGCQVVITEKGDAKEYFEQGAFYCDPASPSSIYAAIERAAQQENNEALRLKIFSRYTWEQATLHTLNAYKEVIASYESTHRNIRYARHSQ